MMKDRFCNISFIFILYSNSVNIIIVDMLSSVLDFLAFKKIYILILWEEREMKATEFSKLHFYLYKKRSFFILYNRQIYIF